MDNSKIFHPNQEHNLGKGLLSVNTFNGRMLYSYPISTIGLGNFQIDTSLVYNSSYNISDFYDKKIGFGNGWKYSFEQFIFKYKDEYNLEGFNLLDYVYIDSNWCIHRFIKYKDCEGYDNPRSVYYDESGTGLKLIVSNNSNHQMFDEYGNTYYFDKDSSKLINIISGVNTLIIKNIEYDEAKDKVLSIYDSRKSNRRIKFDYNQNNLPEKSYSTHSNIYYTFEYDNEKLVRIFKGNDLKKKKVHEFLYDKSLINCIINNENYQAIKLEYNLNNNYVLNKITLGAMKYKVIAEDIDAELYCGDDLYSKGTYYINHKGKKYIESNFMPNEYIYSIITYDYHLSYTEETNKKGIKMRYYFDIDGHQISSLEYNVNNNNSLEFHHYTSSKPTGWEIGNNGDSNFFINDKRASIIYKNNNKYSFSINNSDLSLFKNIFLDETEKTSEHFSLSFWLMFNDYNDSDLLAKVNYTIIDDSTGSDNVKQSQVIIKNTLGGTWQYVSVPLNLETSQTTLKNISIVFDADAESTLENTQLFIADIRINKGNKQTICIDNLKSDDKSYMELKIGGKLYYYDNYEREVTLSPQFYMTEADIIATYRSLYYSIKNDDTYYELFYCNKTKIKAVTYISMLPFYLTNDLTIRNNHKYYTFDFGEYIDEHNKQNLETPNYHFRYIDLVAINENKKSYRVTEIQRKIKERKNDRFVFETHTLINVVDDNKSIQRLDVSNSVCSVVEENDDGTEIKKKYIKRLYGDDNQVEREIYIINENVYDSFGNLLKVITKANASTNEQLVKEYTYYESNPEKNEYVDEIKENGNIVKTLYNEDGNINNLIFQYDKKYINGIVETTNLTVTNRLEYLYNDFNELIGLNFYDSNNKLIGENKLNYNKYGTFNKLNNKSNVNYGFIYNAYAELCEIYRNKKLLQRQIKELTDTYDIYKYYVYHGNSSYSITDVYDEVNRLKTSSVDVLNSSMVENVQNILFEYEDNMTNFSRSLERIKKIKDLLTNKTYVYEYEDSIEDGTTTKIIENNDYSITIKSNGAKIYDIPNDKKQIKYISEIEDQMNNNPKYSYNYTKLKKSDEWEENIYNSFDYAYDDLGRLISKKLKPDEYTNATIFINKNISYYENTCLPKEIIYNVNSKLKNNENTEVNANLIYENSYVKGNVVRVLENGSRFIKNPKNISSLESTALQCRITDYEYDDNDRLIKEVKSDGSTYMYTYGELSGMIEKVSKDTKDNIIKILEYKSGQLTKVNDYDIIYDNYGNIVEYNDISISYNFKNLMKKYVNANDTYLFEYNYEGIRTKKQKNNDYEVNYYLDGTKIIGEDVIDLNSNQIIRKFRYYYDANDICGINYIIDDVDHFFNLVKDSLGNISKVMYRGKIVGEYIYDAWGNCETKIFTDTNPNEIDNCIVNYNPFRFKGYYCDLETNLYYCQSRYYNPRIYQWLSPDSIEYLDYENINGLNLYCYCDNNPINRLDSTGYFTLLAIGISLGLSLLFEVIEDVKKDGKLGGDKDAMDYLGATISGILGGMSGPAGALLGVFGDLADAAISGDLAENGLGATLQDIVLSNIVSFGVDLGVKGLFDAKQFKKLTSNANANKKLVKSLGGSYSFKKNGKTAKAFKEAIKETEWFAKKYTSQLVSELTTLIIF